MTVCYVAWDSSASAGKTGDVGNHTLRWVKDGTSSAPTNTPTEVDSTNAPGIYKLTLTATETQTPFGLLCGKSSTANVVIAPVSLSFERVPDVNPGAVGGLPTLDSNLRLDANVIGDLNGNVTGNLLGNVIGNVEGDLNGTLAALSANALVSIVNKFRILNDVLSSTTVTPTTVTLTGEYSTITNAFAGCVLINRANDTTLKQVRNIISSQTVGGVTELTIDGTWLSNPIDGDSIAIYECGNPVIGDLGAATQADIGLAVWNYIIDGTRSSSELMRGMVAALLGKSSGHAAGTPKYRDIADTKDVISATTDSDGNRTAVTTDLS